MKKIIMKYDKPGKWEVMIPFEKVGEEREWVGIVDARGAGEYELRVTADHKARGTKGRITVRAVVGEGAVVGIIGMVKIRKEAQATDDFLELRVLTLDEAARATAEPRLEIEANNVKASHAASIGPIDKEQILYLMSRGLDVEQARSEVVEGWLGV
ncbi:MAG: SufD family Fe-S cluster assembly protein [bacterium]